MKNQISINGVILNDAQSEILIQAFNLFKEKLNNTVIDSEKFKNIQYIQNTLDPNVKKTFNYKKGQYEKYN